MREEKGRRCLCLNKNNAIFVGMSSFPSGGGKGKRFHWCAQKYHEFSLRNLIMYILIIAKKVVYLFYLHVQHSKYFNNAWCERKKADNFRAIWNQTKFIGGKISPKRWRDCLPIWRPRAFEEGKENSDIYIWCTKEDKYKTNRMRKKAKQKVTGNSKGQSRRRGGGQSWN